MISEKALREIREIHELDEQIEATTIDSILERHKKEIVDFQEECKHNVLSDWGYYVGGVVKVCRRCHKLLCWEE